MTKAAQDLNNQAEQLFNDKKYQEVIDLLNDTILAEHNESELYCWRAWAYNRLENGEAALVDSKKAIQLDPNNAKAHRTCGTAKANLGKYEEAITDYDKAIKLNPNDAIAYYNRGVAKKNLGQLLEYIKDYDEAIRINPEYAFAYNNRGSAKHSLGQYTEAIADHDEAIRINPEYAFSYNNRGNAKYGLGQYTEAIADYDKAIRLNPELAEAYNNRGNTKRILGQYIEAIADFDNAIKLNPDSLYYRNKGLALENLNRLEEALACYQKAIDLNPNDDFAKQLLDELRIKLSTPTSSNEEIEKLKQQVIAIVKQIEEELKVKDDEIKDCLIGHYTKTPVADLLLCKQEDKGPTYNTGGQLRYYNASYMNDPTEGRILLDFLGKDDDIKVAFENAERGEDSIIYIGSFVQVGTVGPLAMQDDNLFMWRTYGKSTDGVEAGGCCMVFSPDLFDKHTDPDPSKRTTAKQALYRVVYIDRIDKKITDTTIGTALTPILKQLEDTLEQLIDKKYPKSTNDSKEKETNATIDNIIYSELSPIRYFFKWSDYYYESELRVVQKAPMDSELVNIDMRNEGKTKLLYVSSNRPVIDYVKKIVLGTKVPNPEHWIYLSHLMARYYDSKGVSGRKFELTRSKSPFR